MTVRPDLLVASQVREVYPLAYVADLFHSNIERLLCLQQALHPDKYTNSTDGEVDLFPFMAGEGRECYKSKDKFVKEYSGSGFSVPGDTAPKDVAAVKEAVKKYLTRTYYW